MPRIQIPSSNIGLGAICNRGGSTTVLLSTNKSTVTYPNQSSPYPLRGSYNNPNYYFWTYAGTSNATKGTVSITYPWSETSTAVGVTKQVFTGVYSYITIRVNVAYGYSFSYWSYSYPGGPAASYSTSFDVYYNGSYYDTSLFANFN